MAETIIVRYTFNDLLECRKKIDNNKAINKLKDIFDQINNKNKPTVKTDLRHKLCCILNKLNTKNYKVLLQEIIQLNITQGQITIMAGELYKTALSNHNFTNLYIQLIADVIQHNRFDKLWCNKILTWFLCQVKKDFEDQPTIDKFPKSFPKVLNGLYCTNLVQYDLINCCVNELLQRKTETAINTATLILMEQSVELIPAAFWIYFSELKTIRDISNKTKYLIMDLGDKFNSFEIIVDNDSHTVQTDEWMEYECPNDECFAEECPDDECPIDETRYEKRANSIVLEYADHTTSAQSTSQVGVIDNIYYYFDDIDDSQHYMIIKYIIIYLFEHSQQNVQIQSLIQCLNDHILKSTIITKGMNCVKEQLDDLEIDFPQCKTIYRDFLDNFKKMHI